MVDVGSISIYLLHVARLFVYDLSNEYLDISWAYFHQMASQIPFFKSSTISDNSLDFFGDLE